MRPSFFFMGWIITCPGCQTICRLDDEEPPPEFLVFADDFQQYINVVIRDEAVPAFLSGGFKLLPAERNRDGEQRRDDKNEKYQ